jgi:hypothetical protein
MKSKEFKISEISKKNIDIDKFVQLAIEDGSIRKQIISNLISNTDIMIYYNCYLFIAAASKLRPDLFYDDWDVLVQLFDNKNSYQRNYGLEIIANLTKVDSEDKFKKIFKKYYYHLNHEKFLTRRYCIQNSLKIMKNMKRLMNEIIDLLLKALESKDLTDKQKKLLKSDVLEILDEISSELKENKNVNKFIKSEIDNKNAKIQKKVKLLISKYGI